MNSVIVLCRRPGMFRAGVHHPAVAAHARGSFTKEQLLELIAEPEITLVIGVVVTAEAVSALLEEPADKTGGDRRGEDDPPVPALLEKPADKKGGKAA